MSHPLYDVTAFEIIGEYTLRVTFDDGTSQIVDLEPETRHRLMDEIAMASAALRSVTGAEKLNVAALGNQVAQLHVHVIARFRDDEAWPGPVWGAVPRKAYDKDARVDLIEKLSDAFQGR